MIKPGITYFLASLLILLYSCQDQSPKFKPEGVLDMSMYEVPAPEGTWITYPPISGMKRTFVQDTDGYYFETSPTLVLEVKHKIRRIMLLTSKSSEYQNIYLFQLTDDGLEHIKKK